MHFKKFNVKYELKQNYVYDVCKIDDFLHSIVLYRIVSYRFTSRIRLSVISSYDS